MYDLVKRKHDQTPTPEKRSNKKDRCQEDEQPDDSDEDGDDDEGDDDEDDDDDDDEDDEDDDDEDDDGEEEEEEKDSKGYQLRKSRPIPNRYTAPPLKSSSKGTCFQNIMSSFYHLFQSVLSDFEITV